MIIEVLSERLYASRLAPATIARYYRSLTLLGEAGVSTLSDVTPAAVRGYLEQRAEAVSLKAAQADLAALCSVLRYLAETGRFERESLEAVRRLRGPTERPPQLSASFLTPAEVDHLCVFASPFDESLVRVAVWSGLRASELAGLGWGDVDWRGRSLIVRGGKTGARRVPCCAPLLARLRAMQDKATGAHVVSASGRRVHRNTIQRRLNRVRDRASMEHVTFTLLRHTRASWWVQAGVPLAKVAAWLGHSVEVCVRFYAGLQSGYDPDCERLPA